MHENAIYPPKFYRPFRAFYATTYGFRNNQTAAENMNAIMRAFAAIIAAGSGTLVFDSPGTCLVNAQANPYESGTLCLGYYAGSNLRAVVESGTILRAADNQQVGATQYLYGFVIRNRSNITIEGQGTLDLNSQNQPGYTGAGGLYGQNTGGHIRAYDNGAAGNTDITIDGLTFLNTFGNPVNLGTSTANTGKRFTVKNTNSLVFGEGIQLIACDGFTIANNTLTDLADIMRGDFYELSNCTDGEVYGNKVFGTTTNLNVGSCFDLFGSKRVKLFGNTCNGFGDGVGMQNGNGGSICDDILIKGNSFINGRSGVSSFADGTVTFTGNVWDAVGVQTALFQFLNTAATTRANFTGERFTNCGQAILSRGSPRFSGCVAEGGAGSFFNFNQVSGYTPSLDWNGGKITGRTAPNGYVALVNGSLSDFAPAVRFHKTDLIGQATGLDWTQNSGSLRNVFYDDCTITTADASRPPESLGSVLVNATLEKQTTLLTTQKNKSLVTRSVIVRVASITGTPGNITLSVGTTAGSYVDVCPSQTIAPTAAGQLFRLTLATASTPAAGAVISVNVTSPGSSNCYLQFTLDGEYQPEFYDTTSAINTTTVPSLQFYLPRGGPFWQDTAGTTPAVLGDRVARWDTGAAGLPRASQGTAGARPVRQSLGLTNFDATSIMDLVDSGGSATTVSLTGEFTCYFTGSTPTASAGWYPITHGTTAAGFLCAQGNSISVRTDAPAAVSVTYGSLGIAVPFTAMFRFRRDAGGVCYVQVTGKAEHTLGTMAGTISLNRVQNWINSMSGDTALRNGSIVVCNANLTPGGATDLLIRTRLELLDGVNL